MIVMNRTVSVCTWEEKEKIKKVNSNTRADIFRHVGGAVAMCINAPFPLPIRYLDFNTVYCLIKRSMLGFL